MGLDPEYDLLPPSLLSAFPAVQDALFEFNRQIIQATAHWACAFKPNLAFYEQNGPPGLVALKKTCDFLRENYPEIPIILDAKRGDIASTNRGYAATFFDYYRADGLTVQPYLGKEALIPFLSRPDKEIFVLCRTSNPGAAEFQDLKIEGEPLFLKIARAAQEDWNRENNVGLVAAATYPNELAAVRKAAPDLPLLIPGIGAQGGSLAEVIKNGLDQHQSGIIINASRSIIYASREGDFGQAAGKVAETLALEIKSLLAQGNS